VVKAAHCNLRPLERDLAEGVELDVGQFDFERGEIFPQVPE
jgi:hypothetical protein